MSLHSVLFIDLDATLIHGPFESVVFPAVFGELAQKTGLRPEEIRRLVLAENQARQDDSNTPAVLAMDWDDIMATVARRLGTELEASPLGIANSHSEPPFAVALDNALEVLRQLARPGRAIVAATKGLARYQLPVLDALGLIPYFDEVLTPDTFGALKRDRAFYGPWPERAPLRIMAGDHYADDVLAPHGFGFKTIWKWNGAPTGLRQLDPFARSLAFPYTAEQAVRPDAIVLSLSELPTVVERLETHSPGIR